MQACAGMNRTQSPLNFQISQFSPPYTAFKYFIDFCLSLVVPALHSTERERERERLVGSGTPSGFPSEDDCSQGTVPSTYTSSESL